MFEMFECSSGKKKEKKKLISRNLRVKFHIETEMYFAVRTWCFSLYCPVDARNCFRTGLFGGEGQTFFRDLLELEESLRKRVDSEASTDRRSAAVEIDETTAKRDYPAKQAGNLSTRDDETRIDRLALAIDPTATSTCRNVDSDIRLERKVNASCLRDAEAVRSIAPTKYVLFSTNYLTAGWNLPNSRHRPEEP